MKNLRGTALLLIVALCTISLCSCGGEEEKKKPNTFKTGGGYNVSFKGKQSNNSMRDCYFCNSTGDCQFCGGDGVVSAGGYIGDCAHCYAGMCSHCDGDGILGN